MALRKAGPLVRPEMGPGCVALRAGWGGRSTYHRIRGLAGGWAHVRVGGAQEKHTFLRITRISPTRSPIFVLIR